jgi:hypothetical protein
MADHPWRCSQCGTINEPVANSCRTCGKWPSLFDLEDNAVDETEAYSEPVVAPEAEPYDAPEPATVEVETFEAETFEPEPVAAEPEPRPQRRGMFEPPTTKPVLEGEESRRARWVSWLVPLAFVVYVVIQYAFSSR